MRTTKELFLDALELGDAARAELVEQVRATDPEAAARLERLLAAHVEEDEDWTLGVSEIARDAFEAEKAGTVAGTRVGDYELLEEVGVGASGVVWRARQVSLGRVVAVKLLRHGRLAGEREVERFRAEAETVARLDHPSIVHVHEVGEVRGRPFFSMRWIDGDNLAAHTKSAWEPRRAARFMITVARGVHHAHQRGLLHRDLKPSNILIDADSNSPHVADFGVARRIDAAETASTSGPVGTPLYMAPEQVAEEQELTVGTDVWALGCILHELLSGSPAFASSSVAELFYRISEGEPDRLAPRVPRDLRAIVDTCLRKDPAARYGSAEALAADLERWLNHEPVQARSTRFLERVALTWRRSPVAVGLTALVVLLVLVIAVGASWSAVRLRQGLRESLLREARATRLSGELGSREKSFELAVEAGRIRPGKDVRDELVASLARTDVRLVEEWELPWPGLFLHAFDRDLERYAWADESRAVFVSRVGSAEPELAIPSTRAASHFHFSPDGNHLSMSVRDTEGIGWIEVWDLDELGAPVLETAEYARSHAHAFSPDGARLAYGTEEGDLVVLELTSGAELLRARMPAGISALHFRPDGSALACAVGCRRLPSPTSAGCSSSRPTTARSRARRLRRATPSTSTGSTTGRPS